MVKERTRKELIAELDRQTACHRMEREKAIKVEGELFFLHLHLVESKLALNKIIGEEIEPALEEHDRMALTPVDMALLKEVLPRLIKEIDKLFAAPETKKDAETKES